MAALPALALGDSVQFAGEDHEIIGWESSGPLQAAVARLRSDRGKVRLVLLGALYTDLAAQQSGAPSPLIAPLEGLTSVEVDTASGDGYLGEAWDPDDEQRWDDLAAEIPEDPRKPQLSRQHEDIRAMLEVLPAAAHKRTLYREAHLLEALTGYRSGSPDHALPGEPQPCYDPELTTQTHALEAKAKELGKSRSTIFRWKQAWEAHGLWGLVPGPGVRHLNPLRHLHPLLRQAIEEQADAEVPSTTGSFRRFYRRLEQRMKDPRYEGVVLPARSTLEPWVRFLLADRGIFGKANSKRTRDLSPDRTFGFMNALRPGETNLMDATRLNIRVYDPVNDVNVDVELIASIDVYTRSILAAKIIPASANATDGSLLLADVLRPEPMRANWQESLSIRLLGIPEDLLIDHDERFAGAAARPVIYPETIVIDHGKIYVSHAFKRSCHMLGTSIQNARKIQPTDKAQMERLFERIGEDFCSHAAGYTGRDATERGSNTEEQARWTVQELQEFLDYYVVAIYQRTPHAGLPSPLDPSKCFTPNEAYIAGVERYGWVAAPIPDDLYYELLPIHWVTVHRYGINLEYRVHDDPILREYGAEPSIYHPPFTSHGRREGGNLGQRKKGNLIPVHVDQRDLLHAYFFAWKHHAWYALRWVKAPDELEPFTETHYRQVRAMMRRHGHDHTDQEQIAQALIALQNEMDAPENWLSITPRQRSKMSERTRAAKRDQAAAAALGNSRESSPARGQADDADGGLDASTIDVSNVIAMPVRRAGGDA